MSSLLDTTNTPDLDSQLSGIAAGLEIVAARRLGNRDDVLEATQETFARLVASVRLGKIPNLSELAPIAYGIARHVMADILRRRAREHDVSGDAPCSAPHPLDVLVQEEECAQVRVALGRLSESDRALLRRCFVNGESIGKIAQESGEPAERVRKRKSRAVQKLAALLHGQPRASGHEERLVAMEES